MFFFFQCYSLNPRPSLHERQALYDWAVYPAILFLFLFLFWVRVSHLPGSHWLANLAGQRTLGSHWLAGLTGQRPPGSSPSEITDESPLCSDLLFILTWVLDNWIQSSSFHGELFAFWASPSWVVVFVLFCLFGFGFEIQSCCVAQAGLEFLTILSQLSAEIVDTHCYLRLTVMNGGSPYYRLWPMEACAISPAPPIKAL